MSAGDEIGARFERVRQVLDGAGGTSVKILAVTKGFGPEAVLAARSVGLRAVGENYAQELVTKADEIARIDARPASEVPAVDSAPLDQLSARLIEWHFIGQLQSKRVRSIANLVSVWQSVDRAKVARQISQHAPGATVLVQVNATGEPQKAGCDPGEVAALVEDCADFGLAVKGLMTVGRSGDTADTRAAFRMVRALADSLGLAECSMGMSADMTIAVEEGSTMVRLGTALFGLRT